MGAGLGFQFLRHVERTSILLHLVDISDILATDPAEDFEKINRELVLYSPDLLKKPMAVVGTKLDISHDRIRLNRLKEYCRDKGLDFFSISSATGEGIRELVMYLSKKVEEGLKK
jgi:GTP-binding protein